MRIGSLCVVVPIDGSTRCPVWFSDAVDAAEGVVIDIYPGTLCTVMGSAALPNVGSMGVENWIQALFPQGKGWIPEMDLEEVATDK